MKSAVAGTDYTVPSIQQFLRDGFVALPEALRPEEALEVRALIDPLFERFDQLPTTITHDVGGDGLGAARSPEIHGTALLEPRILQTAAFARCTAIARALLGPDVVYDGDRAIYKPPFNGRETAWHQDYAYSAGYDVPLSLHFWVPLQDTPAEKGCMRFVPGSHRQGLIAHERIAADPRNATLGLRRVDESQAVVCPLPLGGLTIHGPLTLHAAGPNHTADTRRAWILHFSVRPTLIERAFRAARRATRRIAGRRRPA